MNTLQNSDLDDIRDIIKSELANGIKTRLDSIDHAVTDNSVKITNIEKVLYGDPTQIKEPGLIGVVLQLAQTVGRSQSIWNKLVEYLVIAVAMGVIILLVQHNIPLK